VFKLLVDESNTGGTDNIDMQLLQTAAKHNSINIAKKLIKKHKETFLANATDGYEKSLVYLATENNSVDVLNVRFQNQCRLLKKYL
jgi:hypothetical protein